MLRPLTLVAVTLTLAAAGKRPVTLEDIAAPPSGVSGTIRWAAGRRPFRHSVKMGLLSVFMKVKPAKQREVIALSKLDAAAAKKKPSAASEATDWTNRRVSQREIQWFADSRHLLVLSAGESVHRRCGQRKPSKPWIHAADDERDPEAIARQRARIVPAKARSLRRRRRRRKKRHA